MATDNAPEATGPAPEEVGPAPFMLALGNLLLLAIVAVGLLRRLIPDLPIGSAKGAALTSAVMILVLLGQARPTGRGDWRRIALFVLATDLAALLAVVASAALITASVLEAQGWTTSAVACGAGGGVTYLFSDFLMKRGLLPGCASWRALRAEGRRRNAKLAEHYRRRHFVAAAAAGLVVAAMAIPVLIWLEQRNDSVFFVDTWSFAGVMTVTAALAVLVSRPPDGANRAEAALAGLLTALIFPVALIALELSAPAVWGPPPLEPTIGSLLRIFGLVFGGAAPTLGMIAAALRLDPASHREEADKPAEHEFWHPFAFAHAAAAAVLFVTVWGGAFLSWRQVVMRWEDSFLFLIDPALAALLMGGAAAVVPLLARPRDIAGWIAVGAAMTGTLTLMAGGLILAAWAWPSVTTPDAGVQNILRLIHLGAVLAALPALAAMAWAMGRRSGANSS